MSKNALIQCIFKEGEHHKFKTFSHTWWNIPARENSATIFERDKAIKTLKKYRILSNCIAPV